MQGKLVPCFVNEKLTETHLLLESSIAEVTENNSHVDVFGMAELVAGYMDCMEEALNYLKDVEQYPDDHPAIVGLRKHLALYERQFVNETIQISSKISSRLPSS